MKKRWVSLLCAALAVLLTASCAVAQEVYVPAAEIAQMIKNGWHETYSAHGRTIEVDIAIDFPAVQAVPVRKVRKARPSPVHNPARWQVEGTYFLYEKTDGRMWPSNGWYQASVERRADQIDWDAPVTNENRYAPRQAFDLFWPELTGAFSADVLDSLTVTDVLAQGHLYAYNRKTKSFGEALTDDSFRFTQAFDSIPIFYAGQHALFTVSGGEARPPLCMLDALVVSPEHFSFSGSLVEAVSSVYEDIPLASLDRVLSVYEELIHAGRLRKVQALRFGYLLCVDPENPKEAYTVPIWVLDGVLFDSPTEEAPPMPPMPPTETMRDTNPYRSLIVYAQSAEPLDVNSTSPLRRTAPTLLSWADVSP